jgi:putative sterol carrier protein
MSVYDTTEQAEHVFGELFNILIADATASASMRDNDLTVRLVHTKPDCVIYVSSDAVILGQDAPEQASVTIKMSCDTAHKLWLGNLMLPTAIATAKVRIRGKVSKVLELVPVLQPAFDRYPELAGASGVAA